MEPKSIQETPEFKETIHGEWSEEPMAVLETTPEIFTLEDGTASFPLDNISYVEWRRKNPRDATSVIESAQVWFKYEAGTRARVLRRDDARKLWDVYAS